MLFNALLNELNGLAPNFDKTHFQMVKIQFKIQKFKKGLLKHTYIYKNDTSSFCAILKKVTLH